MDPTKKAFSLLDEFKAFALKGNVIDLAVGVIIGTAFGKIVTALVDKILMPLVGALSPAKEGQEAGYRAWKLTLNGSDILFGEFLGEIVNFLILALVLFIFIVKFLGWIMKSKKQEVAAPPAPTKDQALLTEIRDLLKQR